MWTMEKPPQKRIKISTEPSIKELSNRNDISQSTLDACSSDFSKIVTTSGFIDKTLMIKTLFENTCKVLITAPRRFGKSTNIDMVKRFLEIDVDSFGKLKDSSTTLNYKLFSENKLKIFDYEHFCKQHLGKHPVIHIDYKPLGDVVDFDTMLSKFNLILKKTFEHHLYLLKVTNLWSASLKLDKFKSFIESDINISLNVYEMKYGFIFLAEVLHKYFGKPVFVLIDEYDAFFNSFMCRDNPDMSRIINFVHSTTADLLKSSTHIDHALLTGVVRLSSEGIPLAFSQCLNGIVHYKFLYKHPFCLYYGLTSKELDVLLKTLIKDQKEIAKCKRIIDKYFSGYEIINKNIKIYSIWSVLKFLENDMKVRNNSCRDDYIVSIKSIFRVDKIIEKIYHLLLGKFIEVDISKPFSKTNILFLNDLMKSLKYKTDSSDDLLFVFLYNLGFLSLAKTENESTISLKVPNQEVFFQFAKLLLESYEINYGFDPKYIKNFQSAANSFRQAQLNDKRFSTLCESLNDLFVNSSCPLHTKNYILSILFIFLASKFSFIKSGNFESITESNQDLITINDHDIALLIGIQMEKMGTNETMEEIIVKTHNQLVNNKYYDGVKKELMNKLRGKVYIVVYFNLNKKVSLAYSFILKEDKEIPKPKIIS